MNIRNYIINNFKDSDVNELKSSIIESVKSNDEVVLPGLGVLFEILWKNSSSDFQNNVLNIIKMNLK